MWILPCSKNSTTVRGDTGANIHDSYTKSHGNNDLVSHLYPAGYFATNMQAGYALSSLNFK